MHTFLCDFGHIISNTSHGHEDVDNLQAQYLHSLQTEEQHDTGTSWSQSNSGSQAETLRQTARSSSPQSWGIRRAIAIFLSLQNIIRFQVCFTDSASSHICMHGIMLERSTHGVTVGVGPIFPRWPIPEIKCGRIPKVL